MKRIQLHSSFLFSFALSLLGVFGFFGGGGGAVLSAQGTCDRAYEGQGGSGSISISWNAYTLDSQDPGTTWYCVITENEAKTTSATSATFDGLEPGQDYSWGVDVFSCATGETMAEGSCSRVTSDTLHAEGVARASGGRASATDGSGGSSKPSSSKPRSSSKSSSSSSSSSESSAPSRPPVEYVDHSVTVSGGANFQPLTSAGIGNQVVIDQGVVSATDVWGKVPPGTRVCFIGRAASGVMFLDAAYSPRLLSQLSHFTEGDNTCVDLPGAGKVVLVGGSAPVAEIATEPLCQIKLQETLRLRDAPGGRSFALVWQYSEVPVYAIDGDWYLVLFQGRTGYIWRHYRNVLWGDC